MFTPRTFTGRAGLEGVARKRPALVEARNVEKASGVREAGEILEGLALIGGVIEKKDRGGGESVYRHKAYSQD